jgi:hypothetical protein
VGVDKMETIFVSYLKKHDLTLDNFKESILKILKMPAFDKNTVIACYISHFDNLGTDSSDVDVYIFTDSNKDFEFTTYYEDLDVYIIQNKLNSLRIDMEVRSLNQLKAFLLEQEKYSYTNLPSNKSDLKMYLRLKKAYFPFDCLANKIVERSQPTIKINEMVSRLIFDEAYEIYDDGKKFLNEEEYELSYESLRRANFLLTGAIAAIYGTPILKEKWYPKVFLTHEKNINDDLKKYYLETMIYDSINKNTIKKVCQKLLDLFQDLNSELTFQK